MEKNSKQKEGEKPFEYLRRMNTNEPFSEETVKNWYIARAFVLGKLKDISFAPGSNGHLHVQIDGDSPLMLAVLRQVALCAHYPNFVEYDQFNNLVCKNRTVITLVSNKSAEDIVAELEKEECLCNLLKYCKHSVYGVVKNEDSYIDLEIEIIHESSNGDECLHFSEADVATFLKPMSPDDINKIDTRKAVYAGRAYCLGAEIDNLPYEDIHGAGRYSSALDTFQYKVLQNKMDMVLIKPENKDNLSEVKMGLSNLFCSDIFESRELAVKQHYPGYNNVDEVKKLALWEKDNDALSLSEHSRWIVEKLILGFRPLSEQERNEYECLFGGRRKAYAKRLKGNASSPAHIDLCSYRDLRRVDPDNMKYDSFLMQAIPLILDKIREETGK